VDAADTAKYVIGSERDNKALNQTLLAARTKPALNIAVSITYLACFILIAKTCSLIINSIKILSTVILSFVGN